jgi:23S rRNA (cytosine1962-C5)-methyltransferase
MAQVLFPRLEDLSSQGFERLISGHPWVLRSHFKGRAAWSPYPALVPLGEHWFFYSPHSHIVLRRLGPALRLWPDTSLPRQPLTRAEELTEFFGDALHHLLKQAWETKKILLGEDSCFRWIFAENDGLPGWVVDVYGPTLVVQIQTAPAEWALAWFVAELKQVVAQKKEARVQDVLVIYQRHMFARKHEGLEVLPVPEIPEGASEMELTWNGLRWCVRPGESQKTGLYLDQRVNHLRTRDWALRLGCRSAWDLCCHEGGFTLHLAKAGLSLKALDRSSEALETARHNARLNKVSEVSVEWIQADVFEFLKEAHQLHHTTDLIVLDPPSFAKTAREVPSALRGLKELCLRSLGCLNTGGMLVACSCSGRITRSHFRHMFTQAAHDARRVVKVLEVHGPSPDHAPSVAFPESDYLQVWTLLVL